MARRAQAVLFDVDGVLLDTTRLLHGVWRTWAAARSLDAALVLAHADGHRSADTVREVAPHLDPDVEQEVLDQLARAALHRVRAMPGAAALLRGLHGTPWAIVSSGSRWFVQRCFAAASLPLPAVRVFGEDVRRGKPAPDGYLRAARRLAVHPADCVVVEDTPDGVRAGTSAGCTVIAVATTHAPVRLRDADRCLPTLSAVADLLPTLVLNGDQ